ncbi:hypothetical protein OSK94_23400, partial [Escherichia coli]|nr:hypothetical protein [Escherichia coli]
VQPTGPIFGAAAPIDHGKGLLWITSFSVAGIQNSNPGTLQGTLSLYVRFIGGVRIRRVCEIQFASQVVGASLLPYF